MLVVLKIPVVYLAGVVWWAIRAEPHAAGGAAGDDHAFVPLTPCGWDEWRRSRARVRRPIGPRGASARRPRVGAHA